MQALSQFHIFLSTVQLFFELSAIQAGKSPNHKILGFLFGHDLEPQPFIQPKCGISCLYRKENLCKALLLKQGKQGISSVPMPCPRYSGKSEMASEGVALSMWP